MRLAECCPDFFLEPPVDFVPFPAPSIDFFFLLAPGFFAFFMRDPREDERYIHNINSVYGDWLAFYLWGRAEEMILSRTEWYGYFN